MIVVVPHPAFRKLFLLVSGQPLEGETHRREFGLAAMIRHDARGQDRGERRNSLEGRVGMPELIGFVAKRIAMVRRHYFAVGAYSGESDEMRAGAERADLGQLRLTKPAREGELAVVVDLLTAEDEHGVLLESGAHVFVGRVVVVNILDTDATDFDAEAGANESGLHGHAPPPIVARMERPENGEHTEFVSL